MRKVILTLLLLLAPSLSLAQTTVNLTVQDTGGQFWSGPWYVTLNPPTFGNQRPIYTILSGGGSTSNQSGTLSISGTASISLPANVNIAPSGTLWAFTVCPASGA